MLDRYKITLNFGSLAGIAYTVLFVVYYFLGINPLGNAGLLSTIFIAIVIYLAIKKTREEVYGGYITYGQALSTGVLTGFIYASFCGIINYIFLNYFFTDVFINHKEFLFQEMVPQLENMEKLLGEAATDKFLEELEKMSETNFAFSDFQGKFLGGLIVSLITAFFMKRNKPFFDVPQNESQND
jgi:hypothetical protein